MGTHGRTALALIVATAALAATVTTASANRLSVSERTYRAIWSGMTLEYNGVTGIQCPLTLEGSFHSRTLIKGSGNLLGYVHRAAVSACRELPARVLTETLPWHVRYASFVGVLPNIVSIRTTLIGFSFRIFEPLGLGCLFRSTAERPLAIVWGRLGGIALEGTLSEAAGFCSPTTFGGNATARNPGGTPIAITLI